MKTVQLATLPTCCLCQQGGRTVTARFDSPINGGSWGYLCEGHMAAHGNNRLASQLTDEPVPERRRPSNTRYANAQENAELAESRRELMAAIEAGDFDLAEDIIGDGDISEWL